MEPPSLLIKSGRVIDPTDGSDSIADILIQNGKIVQKKSFIPVEKSMAVINASGLVVAPGFIDIHTHLREPGFEHKETIASGTSSAIAGGFTSIACMANTNPVNDSVEITKLILQKSKEAGLAKVLPIASVTLGMKGQKLSSMDSLKEAGVVAFSEDGKSVKDSSVMARALGRSRVLDIPIIAHCEDQELSPGGVMNEGPVAKKLGLKGIPNEAENVMVRRDIRLARENGGRLHVAHISTAEAVGLVRRAKRDGIDVTCETTPHHFTLTDETVSRNNPDYKMSPPLRSHSDVEAILEGLADGAIDAIATDHAPHSPEEKSASFENAPLGIVGLETALPLVLNLVRSKVLNLPRAVALLTNLPAKILNLPQGRLQIGAEADITIFDPNREWVVDPANFKSKGRNTPFTGRVMKGKVVYTIVGGKILFKGETNDS